MRPALTLPQAAEALAVNYHTVREWVLTGRLKAFRPGRHWKVDQAEIERLKRATTYQPGSPIAPGPFADPKPSAPPSRPQTPPSAQALEPDIVDPQWEIPLPSEVCQGRRRRSRGP